MRRAVLRTIDSDGPLCATEVAEQVDGHPITVDQACTGLHEEGYIEPIGVGRYDVTDDGRELLRVDENRRSA